MSENGNGNGKQATVSALLTTLFAAALTAAVVFLGQQSFRDHDSLVEVKVRLARAEADLHEEKNKCADFEKQVSAVELELKQIRDYIGTVEEKAIQYFEIDSRKMLVRMDSLENEIKDECGP